MTKDKRKWGIGAIACLLFLVAAFWIKPNDLAGARMLGFAQGQCLIIGFISVLKFLKD